MKKILIVLVSLIILSALVYGCNDNGKQTNIEMKDNKKIESDSNAFSGQTLSILSSSGWMDEKYDKVIENFENNYGVKINLQNVPNGQYNDILVTKLANNTCADIFWLQSTPFQIKITIPDYEKQCLDFTNSSWLKKIPEELLQTCMVDNKIYGLIIRNNSPESVMIYNKTLFKELGINKTPKNYSELLSVCEIISKAGITPWFMPGADAWRHPLCFFPLGGLFQESTPELYEKLSTNKIKFADNAKMLEVLTQFKELSDKGYFGEDWVGTDGTNVSNEFADRNYAMFLSNSGIIKQIQEDTGTKDEFGIFLNCLGDNDYLPFNPAGPIMLGNKKSKNEELIRTFFDFVCTTESLQSILDNAISTSNLNINDDQLKQHWLPEEKEFMDTVPENKQFFPYLHVGINHCSDHYYEFGNDMISYCYNKIEANDILKNLDKNRAISAKLAKDPNWD